MNNKIQERFISTQAYAVAYKEHYLNNNLKEVFNLYRDVIAAYPGSQEATYPKKTNRKYCGCLGSSSRNI